MESGKALTTISYKKALIKAASPGRAGEAFRALHMKWAAESTRTVSQTHTPLRKFAGAAGLNHPAATGSALRALAAHSQLRHDTRSIRHAGLLELRQTRMRARRLPATGLSRHQIYAFYCEASSGATDAVDVGETPVATSLIRFSYGTKLQVGASSAVDEIT